MCEQHFFTNRKKMENLWSKENREGFPKYINLFENVANECKTDWKHKFLNLECDAVKSKLVASGFESEGDACFGRKEFHKAMELYNQALCFVESNLQKGVLYANRALCFYHLSLYEKCIADTKLALDTELAINADTVKWKAEMIQIQENCEQLLSTAQCRTSIEPKLSFDADTTHPCMANVLQINKNELETFIVAKRNIDIGQTVLLEEAFTSIAVGYDTAFCLTCKRMCMNLMPCAKCTDAMFCSVECMQHNDVHKMSCGEPYNRMPSHIKLVVQSILEAIATFPKDVYHLMQFVNATVARKHHGMEIDARISNYGLFFGLKTSTEPVPIQLIYEAYTTLMNMPSIPLKFATKNAQRFLMHLVGHHVKVLLSNSYGGFEEDQNQFIFASMTNVASLFQHSCTPNLMQHTIGNRTILITIQPVAQGDRLYIDYMPEEDESEQRTEKLKKDFGIVCKCDKCNPLHPKNDAQLRNDPTFQLISSYKQHIKTSGIPGNMKEKCVEFLQNFKERPWSKEKEVVINVYTQCLLAELNK